MSANSNIEWTDTTWNPVRGCTRISPGCVNCYAERDMARKNSNPKVPGCHGYAEFVQINGKPQPRWTGRVELIPEKLTEPLRWRKPRRTFVNSMSDLFHESLPDEAIDQVFAVMALCPQHTFQCLTKRARRMREYLCDQGRDLEDRIDAAAHELSDKLDETWHYPAYWPLSNVHLGVSVESPDYLWRLDELEQCPAAVRFASLEPLLADLGDIRRFLQPVGILQSVGGYEGNTYTEHVGWNRRTLDWVVIGGESGPGARPFDLAWARSIIRQCKAADVAVFMKQLGAFPVEEKEVGTAKGGCHVPLKLKSPKGGDPSEWPEDLRVREYPVPNGSEQVET